MKNWKAVLTGLLIIVSCMSKVVSTSTIKSCIESKSDLQFALLSTTQGTFARNHHNLSRALFPPAQIPSLYIKLLIRFANISSNGKVTFAGQPIKYTWSKSCLYVATKFMSLHAMNIYSLGAVWPNRRETKLELTLPPFCSKSERDVEILNFIATLEDLAIVSKSEDPRLNTVECVLEGHDNFQGGKLGFQRVLDIFCWLIFAGSVVVAIVALYSTKSWLEDRDNVYGHEQLGNADKERLKAYSVKWLFYILGLVEFLLTIVALVSTIVCQRGSFIYPLVFFCVTAFPLIIVIVKVLRFFICKRKFEPVQNDQNIPASQSNQTCLTSLEIIDCCACKVTVFDVIMILSFFMTFHNLIWVLLGVVTEPTWAVPVALVLFSNCYCLYSLLYYNKRDMQGSRAWGIFFSIFLFFALGCFFYGLSVVGQTFSNRDPIPSFITSVLFLSYLIWINRFKTNNKKNTPSKKEVSQSNYSPV